LLAGYHSRIITECVRWIKILGRACFLAPEPAQVFLSDKAWIDKGHLLNYSETHRMNGTLTIVEKLRRGDLPSVLRRVWHDLSGKLDIFKRGK
jgi:hypothetical protein